MTLTIAHKYLRELLNNLSEENFDDFLLELQFSSLYIPVTEFSAIPIMDNGCIPLFTDHYELMKYDQEHEFHAVDHEYNYYSDLLYRLKLSGFVINPGSENFEISGELLRRMKPNSVFSYDYQPFTVNEIRKIMNSIENSELNDFLQDDSNLWDMDTIMAKLQSSTPLTLLISDDDLDGYAEDGVITKSLAGGIQKCVYEIGGKNYLLLFSREIRPDCVAFDGFKYSEMVNFALLVEEVLFFDFDGIILNVDEENIVISRENLRTFTKGFSCPVLDDYSMYAFPVTGEE